MCNTYQLINPTTIPKTQAMSVQYPSTFPNLYDYPRRPRLGLHNSYPCSPKPHSYSRGQKYIKTKNSKVFLQLKFVIQSLTFKNTPRLVLASLRFLPSCLQYILSQKLDLSSNKSRNLYEALIVNPLDVDSHRDSKS